MNKDDRTPSKLSPNNKTPAWIHSKTQHPNPTITPY